MAGRTGPNKLSVTARDSVWKVYNEIGGAKHMKRWAEENPTEFYKLYARLIPTNLAVAGEDGGPVKLEISWSRGS